VVRTHKPHLIRSRQSAQTPIAVSADGRQPASGAIGLGRTEVVRILPGLGVSGMGGR